VNENNDEKNLLLSIKIIPLVLVSILAIIGIVTAIYINKTNFSNEIAKVKHIYLNNQKALIKNEIDKIHRNIINETQLTKERLKINIKEKVNIAHSIATNIYEEYKTTKTPQEIKELIKNALVNIRFNKNRGYFFIYSLDYECILLPVARQLEGKNFYDFKDGKGMYLTRKIVQQMKKDKEGFLTWWYHKPSDMKKQYEKIGYNKYFEPLNWFIGTGEYVKDFEETTKESIAQRLSTYKYGKDGYIFILDKDSVIITHPDKKLRGTNQVNLQDKNGLYISKELVHAAKNTDGFFSYTFQKYSENEEKNKISYVTYFKEWDWIIGTGFYTDDLERLILQKKIELEEAQKKDFKTIIIVSIILIVINIIFSLLLSYTIQNRFKNYKEKEKLKDRMIAEQSKMVSMGEMIGNIAHQWRQPLSVISTGATGMLAQKEFNILSDEQFKNTCNSINQSAQYLSNTIDDFKNFIKGDREKRYFIIEKSIQSFLSLVNGSIKAHQIEVVLDVDKNIKINGYENELIQCFINIFNNAKDALKTNVHKKRLFFIKLSNTQNHIIIKFRDNANGIDNKLLEKIFEPYFTTKHKSQGTGLGLHIAYKFITDGMNGVISVKNKTYIYKDIEYTGAEFTIKLSK